ncbi:family 43 putative glycoside hydrolase [Triangularia setosa]|uniref:Family 43 putative glycoside hydrolase n=1 Tax=Triangularia setosa TaxID=2587417 RepID=A0AAN6VY69_9PEZI|nr:family 43 putative glycoside hydrolase [Podospora setosa]
MDLLRLLTTLSLLHPTTAVTFANPLRPCDGSDPHIVHFDGFYYLMTTTWTNLRPTRAKTSKISKPARQRCCNVRAPELYKIDNTWYIYCTAGNRQNLDGQRSHVVRGGSHPWNNYYGYAGQLTPQWVIDRTVLIIAGKNYFIYSCLPQPHWKSFCITEMTSFTPISGWKVLSEPSLPWERVGSPVNDGATALYNGTKIWVGYSRSYCWTDSYQLGLLAYKGVGDPAEGSNWVKGRQPVFSSSEGNWGTGHNAFFTSPDGTETWNVYHATTNRTGNCDGNRYTAAKKVEWRADGTPDLGRA